MQQPVHRVLQYFGGLRSLAESLKGDEVIYSGIRPYDYHAGNRIVLAVYPHLLARSLAQRGLEPRFRYVITLNDLEPSVYDDTVFRATGASYQLATQVDAIIGKVEGDLVHLRKEFPRIEIQYYKTSDMVGTPHFQRAVSLMMQEPVAFLRHFLREEILEQLPPELLSMSEFFGLVCPSCKVPVHARQAPKLEAATCEGCNTPLSTHGALRYWMYFVPLLALKLRVVQPDVVLLGGDYLEADEGALVLKQSCKLEEILEFYGMLEGGRPLTFLIPPLLMGKDGQKMSKSLGNVVPYRYEEVLAACGSSDGSRLTL
ncbi:hypothetical protein CYFUS_004371 [Cystobacter fuscus]|uniref:Tryptophan--tRNA ligase n=1 Tax=Cystobacter fuscus TaxID=43 RepID=A0A250J4S9_9BACT|nr:hypothetical protein [Cystobacter fuscus]ATB38934.1 hypothetical protein CYFUS_004371 [Cystobacter fuscus]